MTFTTRLKEEISKISVNDIERSSILEAFLKYNAFVSNNITITLENASVARYIYVLLKEEINILPKVRVRIQKRFRVKQIYIIEINDKVDYIKERFLYKNSNLDSDEEKIAYLKGAFLGIGNVSNPKTSGYHLEFILNKKEYANYISKLLNNFNLNSKVIKRGYKYITYIKMSESISDLIKMFKATNSLFEFEDTRIYRDHKNMVNRLNNCEIANQEKAIKSGLDQINIIKFLENNDLLSLLDEKTRLVLEYRKKYPESSYQELANIISLETDYKVGKSGVNHHFIKLRNFMNNYIKNKEE